MTGLLGQLDWRVATATDLLARLLAEGFRGYDPYDGMNARLLAPLARRSLMARRVVTQVIKRTPFHVQPLVGAPPLLSATTLGYAMLALSRLHRIGALPTDWASLAPRMVGVTKQLAVVASQDQLAWGSQSDVATRFGFTRASTPNVVVTACSARGLAALTAEGLVDERYALRRIAQFMVQQLGRREGANEQWFAYKPDGNTMIHNGNMLAAATLIRCGSALGDDDLVHTGVTAALTTTAYQAANGSWPYAEDVAGRWEDSFHTGFILEGLLKAVAHDSSGAVAESLRVGGEHYVTAFFGSRGEPWYSAANHYPLDAMSAAQGLDVLPSLAKIVPEAATLRDRLAQWCGVKLLRPEGQVAYQVHRGWTDWRQFPRWSVAPIAAALAGLSATSGRASGDVQWY